MSLYWWHYGHWGYRWRAHWAHSQGPAETQWSRNEVGESKERVLPPISRVPWLHYTISADGLDTTDDKVSGILKAPAPKDVTELRSFPRLVVNSFQTSLQHYLPCTVYFRSNKKWVWGRRQDKEFDAVKDLLKSSRGLVHFNSKLPLILSCDTSQCRVGAVLCHEMADGGKRPVALTSYTLTTAEKKYSQLGDDLS